MTYVEQYGIACMTLAPEEFDEVFSLVFSDCDPHFELFSVREGAARALCAAHSYLTRATIRSEHAQLLIVVISIPLRQLVWYSRRVLGNRKGREALGT